MFRFSHLLKVTAVIACALAVMAVGASGALAAGSADDLEQVQAKLRECVKTLREIDAERRDADTMLTLAERSKIVLINDEGSLLPIEMDTWSLFADFQLRAGIITQKRYDEILRRLTNGRARTLKALRSIVEDLEHARDEQDQICAFLVKLRDRLKEGGGPPKAGAGGLQREGAPTVTPYPGSPYTWKVTAGSDSATVETPFGDADLSWELPATIPKAGVKGKLTVIAKPGKAETRSNLAATIDINGEVDVVCSDPAKSCRAAQAHSLGGNTVTNTVTFTVKARSYTAGRKEPVYLLIGLGPSGPTVKIPYRVVD